MKKYPIVRSLHQIIFCCKKFTYICHIYDITVKTKKLGEQCSTKRDNCVGGLVCQKIEDDCNNGVGICQPKGRKKCSLVVN